MCGREKLFPPGRFPFIHAWLFLVLQVLIVRPLLGSPRSEKSTIENQRMDADRRQALETPSADAVKTSLNGTGGSLVSYFLGFVDDLETEGRFGIGRNNGQLKLPKAHGEAQCEGDPKKP